LNNTDKSSADKFFLAMGGAMKIEVKSFKRVESSKLTGARGESSDVIQVN
jgi:hypothetical protein